MNNHYDLLYSVRQEQLYRLREADRLRQSRLARQAQLQSQPQSQKASRLSLKQRLGQQLISLGQRLSQGRAIALDEA